MLVDTWRGQIGRAVITPVPLPTPVPVAGRFVSVAVSPPGKVAPGTMVRFEALVEMANRGTWAVYLINADTGKQLDRSPYLRLLSAQRKFVLQCRMPDQAVWNVRLELWHGTRQEITPTPVPVPILPVPAPAPILPVPAPRPEQPVRVPWAEFVRLFPGLAAVVEKQYRAAGLPPPPYVMVAPGMMPQAGQIIIR